MRTVRVHSDPLEGRRVPGERYRLPHHTAAAVHFDSLDCFYAMLRRISDLDPVEFASRDFVGGLPIVRELVCGAKLARDAEGFYRGWCYPMFWDKVRDARPKHSISPVDLLELEKWAGLMQAPSRKYRRNLEDGDELDTDRAMRGEWESAWAGPSKHMNDRTTLTMLLFSPVNWCANSKHSELGGAALLAAVDAVESRGIRTEVICVSAAATRDEGVDCVAVDLKRTHESADPSRLCLTQDIGFVRLLNFTSYMRLPFQVDAAMLVPLGAAPAWLPKAVGITDDNFVIVPGEMQSLAHAKAWLKEVAGKVERIEEGATT